MPGSVVLDLSRLRLHGLERLQGYHAAHPAAETGNLPLLLYGNGEVGHVELLLHGLQGLVTVCRIYLCLGLREFQALALVAGVVNTDKVRSVLGRVHHREAQVHKASAPQPAGKQVRTPLDLHADVVAVGIHGREAYRLLVACRRVEHSVVVGEPAVEIAVPRGYAGIVFRLE